MEEQQEVNTEKQSPDGVMVSTGFDARKQIVVIHLEAQPGVVEINEKGNSVLQLLVSSDQAVHLAKRLVADALMAGFDRPVTLEVPEKSEA